MVPAATCCRSPGTLPATMLPKTLWALLSVSVAATSSAMPAPLRPAKLPATMLLATVSRPAPAMPPPCP